MKAVRIHEPGGVEVLRFEDADRPSPGPGEVLIRVAVAGVNPADYKHRVAMFASSVKYVYPKILGYDVAGVVAALGEGVAAPPVGTRVCALLDPMIGGGYAEYVTTAAAHCAVMPEGLSFETAAAAPCAALTGLQLVEDVVRPSADDTILVTGATGMVGRFALHALKGAGAKAVAGVRRDYADEARALGADVVIPLEGQAWEGRPFDGVIDTVGGTQASVLARSTVAGGHILTAATNPLDAEIMGRPAVFVAVRPDGQRLERLARELAEGRVGLPIAANLPLAEAGRAHALLEAGGVRGKVVLTVDAALARQEG